ncbi:NAD-dependent epimerase/dehydratase family protein [Allochromatium palmeri]|uniref:NAD-dependent epimerase/dehydratase family protein n=1 Tax=Allochromatium palmeri TaxID=231048 RepID=A0A6N8EKW4_9GAMM|nr:NAD-dependent epimerase/dehydratase family protein [Allochromatium palmeri]
MIKAPKAPCSATPCSIISTFLNAISGISERCRHCSTGIEPKRNCSWLILTIARNLTAGHTHLITRTHAELDLTDQAAVETFFADQRPTQVYLAAAKVGGIHANDTYPTEFLDQNLLLDALIKVPDGVQQRTKIH